MRDAASDKIKKDAAGQFEPSQGDRKASGVASAKPTVITGSEDVTGHRTPPGQRSPDKEWDLTHDPVDKSGR